MFEFALPALPSIPQVRKSMVPCRLHRIACVIQSGFFGALFSLISQSAVATVQAIHFRGELTQATCTLSTEGQASGSGHAMLVDFGKVAMLDVRPPDVWEPAIGKVFVLSVSCPNSLGDFTLARITFDARSGSGIDHDVPSLLRLSADSTARGVAVGVWNPALNAPLNLSADPFLNGLYAIDGDMRVAKIAVATLFSRTGAPAASGSAHGMLPVRLSHE